MSPYIILYIALLIITMISFKVYIKNDVLNILVFILLTLFACLRYGQGTDYFGYKFLFNQAGKLFEDIVLSFSDLALLHGEWGWLYVYHFFNRFNISFEFLVICISLYEMFMLRSFINKYGARYKILSWLLVFPTIYLTYIFSALRQGVVLVTFLGIMLEYLVQKRYVLYYLLCALCMLIHTAAVILVIVPVMVRFKTGKLELFVVISFLLGFIIRPLLQLMPYSDSTSYSLIAICERVFWIMIVYYLYHNNNNHSENTTLFYKIYLMSICIHFLLMSSDLVASRFSILLRSVEVVLIPLLLLNLKFSCLHFMCILILINAIMFTKNINSYIQQGNYYDQRIIKYPYVSIFNKEKIYNYLKPKYAVE